MKRPDVGIASLSGEVSRVLSGRHAEAFLQTLDMSINPAKVTWKEKSDVLEALEDMLDLTVYATERMLRSPLEAMKDIGEATMQAAMAHRLVEMGINPLGIALLAQMELGGITILDGVHTGTVIECMPTYRSTSGHEVSPSFHIDNLVWCAADWDVSFYDRQMPETTVCQMKGRRVDAIVDSALVNGLDLRVARIDTDDEIQRTSLILEEAPQIRFADLAQTMVLSL